MAEPSESTERAERPRSGLERAAAILAEIACAAGSAAVSLAEQQKAAAVTQIDNAGEALRAAARSLEGSHNTLAADYTGRAAAEIAGLGAAIGERRWREIAGDVEAIGHRRPALFAAGAALLGFLAGRFWIGIRRAETPPAGSETGKPAAAETIPSAGGSRLPLSAPSFGAHPQ
jgi:hypothetical protein